MLQKTEILIIGGGIAGCIAAISLAEKYQVTIVDKLYHPIDRVGESLAPACQRILKKLRILQNEPEEVTQQLYTHNLGMQSYWGSDNVQFVDHLRNPDGPSKSLHRKNFESYLRKLTAERKVKSFWGYKLHHSVYNENSWEVTIKSDDKTTQHTQTVSAKFVIDATGRNSHFARSLGIKRVHFDKLISCWISLPNNEVNNMSTIVSEKLGWWYSAVTPHKKRIVSFQTDPDLVNRTTFKNKENFLQLIKTNSIIKQLIPSVPLESINFHGTVSANSTRLQTVAGKQWIALGDAAISFDPLSSQGMFNAMACAMQVKILLDKFDFIKQKSPELNDAFTREYKQQISSIWKHYLKHKNIFYNVEKRWKDAPFWTRRQQA
ncbi:Flavin-dependent dehydrogenase [Tenacibaculum sp. 190130A14a]|uniref:Flavin-dependent dehydrogenase n=1 Tax=Tenacibaculum polynesiense TaxID=3137857 RepID=A0ABM9P6M9_9FLAO